MERAQESPWSFVLAPRSFQWDAAQLSMRISHAQGGDAVVHLHVTKSASGKVALKLEHASPSDLADERTTGQRSGETERRGENEVEQRAVVSTQRKDASTDAGSSPTIPYSSQTRTAAEEEEEEQEGPSLHRGRGTRDARQGETSLPPSSLLPSPPDTWLVDESSNSVRSGSSPSTLQRESLLLLLPIEIQQHIFSYLPIKEIFTTVPLVCRDIYHKTLRDDVFWHGIHSLHFGGVCKLKQRKKSKAKTEEGPKKTNQGPSGSEVTSLSEASGIAREKQHEEEKQSRLSEGDTTEDGEEEGKDDLFWKKMCARLMKELHDMEQDYQREIMVLEADLAKMKRKKARMYRRRLIKYAVERGHLPLLRNFVRGAAASVDTPLTEKKATPLMFASIRGNIPVVEWLLVNGANVNAVEEGCTWQPIIHASQGGHAEALKILISHGANVNSMTEKGGTPLMHATYEGYEEVVKVLLENGANVNAQSKNGESALMMAAEKGHANIVRMLLEHGADTTLTTHHSKRTALWFAKENKQEEVVSLFEAFSKKTEPDSSSE